MAIKKMPIADFVKELEAALNRKDGYIMGSTGQNPKKWSPTSWWFTQYNDNASQKAKALYWRENAERVWDCNGMAEGIYKDFSGVNIDTKARYNYKQWCDPKGEGIIPPKRRVAGAAVFWGNSASDIHHVAYLYKPVKANVPEGDWYLIEARGVMYGVVKTKLSSRNPNFWGWMTKYYEYSEVDYLEMDDEHLGAGNFVPLKNGSEGNAVREMQANLIRLGYDCGKWGADGDFGDATEIAVRAFQKEKKLAVTGIFDAESLAAMEKALANLDKTVVNPTKVKIVGGNCYARSGPTKEKGKILGVAKEGETYFYQGQTSEDGWNLIIFQNANAWVSGKYSRLVK